MTPIKNDYENVTILAVLQLRYIAEAMTDVNETRALKASFRGTLDTASQLSKLQGRIDALDDHVEIDNALLEDLGRVTVAHAVASAALRGLVIRMQTRRGAATSA